MTNVQKIEKLDKLISKAVDGGFDKCAAANWIRSLITDDSETTRRFAPMLIFNHDFAKALFGEEPYDAIQGHVHDSAKWMIMLQCTVISEDPITYMYDKVFRKE